MPAKILGDAKKQYVLCVAKDVAGYYVMRSQCGKLNFPGGKVEPFEAFQDAASREFAEETGVKVPADQWASVGFLEGDGWIVRGFYCMQKVEGPRSMTDEPVVLMSYAEIQNMSKDMLAPSVKTITQICQKYEDFG